MKKLFAMIAVCAICIPLVVACGKTEEPAAFSGTVTYAFSVDGSTAPITGITTSFNGGTRTLEVVVANSYNSFIPDALNSSISTVGKITVTAPAGTVETAMSEGVEIKNKSELTVWDDPEDVDWEVYAKIASKDGEEWVFNAMNKTFTFYFWNNEGNLETCHVKVIVKRGA